MLNVSEADIDRLTAAIRHIAKGRTPAPLPSGQPESEITPLIDQVNALIAQTKSHAELTFALSKGDLFYDAPKGPMLNALKSLQSNLIHLKWVTEQISKGDLSQRVDFLGDFSSAFNLMVDKLQHRALHDPLTSLPNRNLLGDRVAHTLAVAKREIRKVAVLYIDLDGFKTVNDTLGHAVGDALLREVASRFQARVRESDTLARLGGDEFVVVLGDIQGKEDALELAQELLNTLAPSFVSPDGHQIRMTASIGISVFPENATEPAELLSQADCAMYEAKRGGRNRVMTYTPELGTDMRERLNLEVQLRAAIDSGEIEVHYQPEFAVVSHRLIRFEALARWFHPSLGAISPVKFIPIAEETGVIHSLGAYVMERACTAAAYWASLAPYPIQVAVNVSGVQLTRENFAELVIGILNRTGLNPELLQLEVTESMMLSNSTSVAVTMERLRACGISLAIDDFGTGYSCLSYLPRLPFNTLKLDRSFISDLDRNPETQKMVGSLIGLAQNLGMRVVAEGIERQEQLNLVRSFGGNEVQGYLLGRPSADPVSQIVLIQEARVQDCTGQLARMQPCPSEALRSP